MIPKYYSTISRYKILSFPCKYVNQNIYYILRWIYFHFVQREIYKIIIFSLCINFVGYWYEPYRVSSRIVTLMLLLASMSLYAAYTANIVGLLQSTADSIKTLPDLLNGPLNLGVQDVVYNRHYFKVNKKSRKLII